MKISVVITLKKDVLDPQGKVIHQTLDGMGFEGINVRGFHAQATWSDWEWVTK